MQTSLARVTASMKTAVARAAGRAEFAACDDRRGEAGQRRCKGREVAQHRGHETARSAPQRQSDEKAKAILRK